MVPFADRYRFRRVGENNRRFSFVSFLFPPTEMAERHDARAVLRMARELVLQLQTLIDDK